MVFSKSDAKKSLYLTILGFLVILCHQSTIVFASVQGISGTIIDAETLEPLENVNIVVQGTGLGTSSDINGHYRFSGLMIGSYEIRATMIGYQPAKKWVTVVKDSIMTMHMQLQPTVLKMQPVGITAKRYRNVIAEPSRESPALELALSTVSQREITRQGAKTLIDAMKYIPGAFIETRGRKVKQFFSVRGQKYPYPTYAINGAWQREFEELPYFFTAADIERIEVIRSSAALLTGLSGMTGVINIIPRQYSRTETAHAVEYGTFGTFRGHLSHGARIGTIAYAAGIGFQHTNGPEKKHAAENMANFYGRMDWFTLKKLTISANIFHINGKQEIAYAVAPAALRYQQETLVYDPYRATLANLKAHYQASDRAASELLVYYSNREPRLETEDYTTQEISRLSESDYEWGINFLQSTTLSANNVLRFGGLYNRWVAPNGKRFYVGRRNDLQTISVVIVDEQRFGAFHLDAGLRWAKTFIDEYGAFGINGSARGFENVSAIKNQWEPSVFQGNLGAVYYLPGQLSLHMNLAAGAIRPRNGALDTQLTTPKNETRVKLDLGVRQQLENLARVSVTGFLTLQKNAIVLSGLTETVANRILELYLNRDQDQLGIELEIRSALLFNSLEGFFNLAAMRNRAKIADNMERDRELPQIIGNGGIYGHRGSIDLSLLGNYVSYFESTRFVASSKDKPAQPQPLGKFLTIDFIAGWSAGTKYHTRFYLEIHNLLDKAYATVVGYPDFGRKLTVGLRQSFN